MFSKISKISTYLKPSWVPLVSSKRHYPFPLNFLHYLQNEPPLQTTRVDNGMTVSTLERKHISHVCIGIFLPAGARYEKPEENGITHFFHHIAYKATDNRSACQLTQDMNASGARFKSFTTRDMSAFYAVCVGYELPRVLNILASVVFFNALDDIANQRRVVYQEMVEHESNSNSLVYDLLHEAAYQDTPLAQTVLGKSGYLCGFDVCNIKDYLRRRFSTIFSHIVCVGQVNHNEVVCIINRMMGHVEPSLCPDRHYYRFTGSEIRFRDDSLPLANVAIAVEAPCLGDENTTTLQIMSEIIGSWDRSMSGGDDNANILGQPGLGGTLVGYKPIHITYKDCGLWGVQYLAPRHGVDDVMLSVLHEFMHLCVTLHPNEVARGKRALKSRLLTRTEGVVGMCIDIGKWMICSGCWPPLHEQIKDIDSKTANDVLKAADHYLFDREPAVATVGPTEELMDMTRIRSGMYWTRY